MKENGALAIGAVQKLKKEYCAEIRLQETAFLILHTTCAINAWKILRGLYGMNNVLIIITNILAATIAIMAIPTIYYFADRIITNKRIKENQIAWDNFSKNMTRNEKLECYLEWCDEQKYKKKWQNYYFPRF